MNIWTFLQVLGAALITALQFNIYLGAYMGMDRGRRDRIYLGLNILNMFFLRVLINTSIQLDAPVWFRTIVYTFGFAMMLVGVVLYRKERMVINLVSFMVGIMTFDLVTVTMSAVIEELFGYAYNDTNPGGYGIYIMIIHGGGYVTLYGHLNSSHISNGQYVSQGQVIATSGNSGGSTGAHLHFEIRKASSRADFFGNNWLNPLDYLPGGYTMLD